MTNKEDPKFFEPCICGKCQSTNNLLIHRYSDEILCKGCLRDLEEKLESEMESYSDSEALTLEERNK